jgi:archaeal flagellin FlaB
MSWRDPASARCSKMSMKNRNEDAFTGLEAAIVLIAFVVVAAVFSYVVLGAGFFTTQKSQQVVHAGVTQAASNIVVKGNVYGLSGNGNDIGMLQFDLGLAAGGLPVDVTKMQMVYSTATVPPTTVTYVGPLTGNTITSSPTAKGTWAITGSSNNLTPLIQEGQYFTTQLYVPLSNLTPRTEFSLEIKPENGASLGIVRTVPAGITNTTILF